MPIDAVWIAVALSGAAAALASLAAFRPRGTDPSVARLNDAVEDLRGDLERLRTALSEDLRRGREEADARGRSQREEAGVILREGLARLDAGSRALRDEVARRLSETHRAGDEAGKALREEVSRQFQAFGDFLDRRLGQSAASQKERLDGVTTELQRLAQRRSAGDPAPHRRGPPRRAPSGQRRQARRHAPHRGREAARRAGAAARRELQARQRSVEAGLRERRRDAAARHRRRHLKRVLTNVKTRGTWGEVSLAGVLDQALAPDQYARGVRVRPESNECVDFAIRLPHGGQEGPLWLPIDAKFPSEAYERLIDAADRCDGEGVERALRELETSIRREGASICEKYVCPPHTTDFAILYLPTEGLYAEVIRRPGLMDDLQRRCRIVVAGPTVLLAILNSLQMGFRTLAIQKRSSEVRHLLSAVKTEFGKYGEVLDKVKKKLAEASNTIDEVSKRRKQIDRKLAEVETLPDLEANRLLSFDGAPLPPKFVAAAE